MLEEHKFWKVLNSRIIIQDRWISLRADRCQTERGVELDPYYVLNTGNFVHLIVLDDAENIILVRQYRHGCRAMSLELPGGLIDGEDASILAAGARELLEETGYAAADLELIASLSMDPARFTGPIQFLFGRGAQLVRTPSLDQTEDIEVINLPFKEAIMLAVTGGINHSSHVAGLLMAAAKARAFRLFEPRQSIKREPCGP